MNFFLLWVYSLVDASPLFFFFFYPRPFSFRCGWAFFFFFTAWSIVVVGFFFFFFFFNMEVQILARPHSAPDFRQLSLLNSFILIGIIFTINQIAEWRLLWWCCTYVVFNLILFFFLFFFFSFFLGGGCRVKRPAIYIYSASTVTLLTPGTPCPIIPKPEYQLYNRIARYHAKWLKPLTNLIYDITKWFILTYISILCNVRSIAHLP